MQRDSADVFTAMDRAINAERGDHRARCVKRRRPAAPAFVGRRKVRAIARRVLDSTGAWVSPVSGQVQQAVWR